MTLDEIGARLEAARRRIDRIYCHWTGAPYQLVECLAYHVVIDRGGYCHCLLYTSDAADEEDSGNLGGRRNIKKKQKSSKNMM